MTGAVARCGRPWAEHPVAGGEPYCERTTCPSANAGGPTGSIPVEQIAALVKLLSPAEMTPTARRMLLSVCDQHRAGNAGDGAS